MREIIYQLLKTSSIKAPALLLDNYYDLGLSLEDTFFILEFLHCEGNLMRVGDNMQKTQEEIIIQVNHLLEKQYMTMDMTTTPEGKKDVVYSLEPLYDKMVTLLVQSQPIIEVADTNNIISLFEQEFGRALSGTELQMISDWITVDQYSEELIKLALKEAVLSQVLNLRYVDRILLSWERKNIQTPQQVAVESQNHRQLNSGDNSKLDDATVNILMQNWLKG